MAGQEITMQNIPHCCLDMLAVQYKEVVFFSGEKEDSLSSNFLTLASWWRYLQGLYFISEFGTKVTNSRYDYSSSRSYRNLFLNVSLPYLAILIPPSAFPNFPKTLPLDSHQAALGQQHHLLARTEKSWTQHPFLFFDKKFSISVGCFSHVKFLTFAHHAFSHTSYVHCSLSRMLLWPVSPGQFRNPGLNIIFLGKPFLKSSRMI